jgi:hypothetical protein
MSYQEPANPAAGDRQFLPLDRRGAERTRHVWNSFGI